MYRSLSHSIDISFYRYIYINTLVCISSTTLRAFVGFFWSSLDPRHKMKDLRFFPWDAQGIWAGGEGTC